MYLRAQLDDFDDNDEYGLTCKDKSLAKQSDAEAADINNIVRNFGLTGQVPGNVRVPLQEDFFEAMDFQEAQNAIIAARDSFMKMPAALRQRLNHDPGEFVEWCADPANLPEMRKLGLAVPEVIVDKPAAAGGTNGVT